MLIYDEVQTGVGITGEMWAHQLFNSSTRPDIISFGKKMQICGIFAGKRIDEVENNVFHESSRLNSTWGGNVVDMVRISLYLEIIAAEDLVKQAATNGYYLLIIIISIITIAIVSVLVILKQKSKTPQKN